MINSGPAQALAELATRTQEMLHAYEPGYETQDDQIRSATLARPKPSNDPMSAAAPEGAYFVGHDASGRTFFSRDGSFGVDGGKIAWPDGSAVLGYPPGAAHDGKPQRLSVDPIDVALGRTKDAHVEADGSVVYSRSVVDPKTAKTSVERVEVGRIALARFPAGTALTRIGTTRIGSPGGVVPFIASPGEGTFGSLATKSRDLGAVDFEAGLNQVREAFLALDAMSASARVDDKDAHVAMDLIK